MATPNYLRNCWYVAGWSREITASLVSREILGESILFFRKQDGAVAAIGNRCPHRFAPLDMGTREGDAVRCAYHGLTFNTEGRCIGSPTTGGRMPDAKVRSYRCEERHDLVWIWTGDAELADSGAIPDLSEFEVPSLRHASGGYLHCSVNYQLLIDNLLDLSHVAFVHPVLGTPSMAEAELSIKTARETLTVDRWMAGCDVPLYLAGAFAPRAKVDHWLDMRLHQPTNMILYFGATTPGGARAEGAWGMATHLLTPETETSSHYFYSIALPKDSATEADLQLAHEAQREAFNNEDKPIVEACQRMMGTTDLMSLHPVILPNDSGAIRARRMLASLIRQEMTIGEDSPHMASAPCEMSQMEEAHLG